MNDTYQGWPNRETWAFNLHWQNDQGLYNETLEQAREWAKEHEASGHDDEIPLGEHIVNYWKDAYEDYLVDFLVENPGGWAMHPLRMMREDVGSWWRVDYASVGEAVREWVETEGS